MTTIDALPDELLLMIFKFMPGYELCVGAARVSRRWARVSRSYAKHLHVISHLRRLRHRPSALLITVNLTQKTPLLKRLMFDLAPYLKELSIHGDKPLTKDELAILQRLPNLRHLDVFARSRLFRSNLLPVVRRLNSFVINETVSKGFLRGLSEAVQLHAVNMYGNALYYPKSALLFFLRASANRLSELTLRCNELNDLAYEVIASCVNLKTLRLYSCWLMTYTGAMYIMRLQQLQCLHITGAYMIRTEVTGRIISELPKSIYELVLCGLSFHSKHFETLSQRLPGLQILELCKCKVTYDALTNLVSSLPNLKYFDTDVRFSRQHKKVLMRHPTLLKVRCLGDDEDSPNEHAMFLPGDARYRYALLRGDGQGYRADLFHYWSLRVPLEIISRRDKLMGNSSSHRTYCHQLITY